LGGGKKRPGGGVIQNKCFGAEKRGGGEKKIEPGGIAKKGKKSPATEVPCPECYAACLGGNTENGTEKVKEKRQRMLKEKDQPHTIEEG